MNDLTELNKVLKRSLRLLLEQIRLAPDKIGGLVFGVDVDALGESILSLVVLADSPLGDTLHDVAIHFLVSFFEGLDHLDTHIFITVTIVFLRLIELAPQASRICKVVEIVKTFVCQAFVEVAEASENDALGEHLV